ncbi:MAG: acyl-CoA reductase [Saprospiraceae bacterium]|nr:acyl-CoA reductase [Saprospiraceae bacterium]
MATNQPMRLSERIAVLVKLGEHLRSDDEYLNAIMHRNYYHNKWFTVENQKKAIKAIAEKFLDENKLRQWLDHYRIDDNITPQTVGLVMAGNIPLVGFHDVLCVFAAGHKALIKLSDKDPYLLPYLFKLLEQLNKNTKFYFEIVDFLKDYDAVIATGSNNSARYFEAYFGKVPNIIRKNRNAIAVLTGSETQEELKNLGYDIFQYYGLGCRNVSKIYVPKGYDFTLLLEALHEFREVVLNDKYKNNFDYNYALYILNKTPHLSTGCIILTEDKSLQSRIAGLHYEFYDDIKTVEEEIQTHAEEIQCVIAKDNLLQIPTLPFGKAQSPELWDYADGVDTMQFLLSL